MVIILTFGAVSIYLYLKQNNNEISNIDMYELNSNILYEAHFSNTRMQDVTSNNVYEIFGIENDKVLEVIGRVPLFNISSGMYAVFHVDDKDIEYVTEKVTNYGNKYEQEWSTYMEDQYELVKQRKVGNIGNYVYIIISENAEDILNCISGNN